MQIWNKLTLRRLLVSIGTHPVTTTTSPLAPTYPLKDPDRDDDAYVTLNALSRAVFTLLCSSDAAIHPHTLQSLLFFSPREAQRFIESVHLVCRHAHTPHQIEYDELLTYIGTARTDTLQQLIRVMKTDQPRWTEALAEGAHAGEPAPTPPPTPPPVAAPKALSAAAPPSSLKEPLPSSSPTTDTYTPVPTPQHPYKAQWWCLFYLRGCLPTASNV